MKPDAASQDRMLDEIESGVDVSQIDESLALSPTERLERMVEFLRFLDEMKAGDGDRLQSPAARSRRA